ncbi:MAG: hypothetical protein AAGC85_24200, partial [Bacteroidota bacterium]
MEIYLVLFLSLFIIEDHTWSEIEIDPQLSELEVDPNDWTYPWYVIKHEDYFENTFGEPITEEDTAHIIRNSFCNLITISDSNESSTRLPFAGARWRDDTLQLNIYQEGASGIVALELDILGEKFTPRFLIYYIHDPEEQSTAYLEQSLILHKLPEKGKPIKGEVNILL